MNCVGIDVSKGKSMIAVMRPFGEVVVSPFEVRHTANELSELAGLLKSLDGETRVVMESTGNYHAPVAWLLHDAGLYVSVVNAMLVHDYGNNSLRRAKTDKKDAVKLANYGLDHWLTLPRYVPEEDTRLMLKTCYRQYQQYSKVQTMLKNNLISLLDTAFPDANRLFTSPPRTDGSEKWWTSQRHFGTVSAFAFYVKKHLFPNTKGGVRNIATTSAKIGHWIFMLLPVVTLMLCRKLILPDFWQNGLSLNSGRPVQHWPS